MRVSPSFPVSGRRGLSGSASELPAVTEELDVATLGGGTATLDITTIGGIAVNNFTHIQLKFQAITRSTTGSFMTAQLRREGGAFADETYVSHVYRSTDANRETTDFRIFVDTATSAHEGCLWLENMNQPCPTVMRNADQSAGATAIGIRTGVTAGAVVHDAIRINSGSGTWTVGTLVVTGYRFRVGSLYTLTWAGEATQDVTLERGEYIASIVNHNCATSGAVSIYHRVATGGTYLDSTSYQVYIGASDSTSVAAGTAYAWSHSGGGTTARYSCGTLFNMQTTQAPVMAWGKSLDADGSSANPQSERHYILTSLADYDQIRTGVLSGTITSGTTYIQTYKPRRTIHAADSLTSHGSDEFSITGLKKNNSNILLVGSTDAIKASAAAGGCIIRADAVGSSDHLSLRVHDAGSTNANALDFFYVQKDDAKTSCAALAILTGIPQPTNTMQIVGCDMTNPLANSIPSCMGTRETAEVHTGVTYRTGGVAPDFSGGTIYAVGYS